MNQGKQPLKVVFALLGLAGAMVFTFSRISEEGGPSSSAVPITVPDPRIASMQEKERETPLPDFSTGPKALRWEDYLSYDPFQGRGKPNAELYALANLPSPFFSDVVPTEPSKEFKEALPDCVRALSLSGIVGDIGQKIAIIDGRPYRPGSFLLDKNGERINDPVYGNLSLTKIESDKVSVQAGGIVYVLSLTATTEDYIHLGEKNSPKLKEKKDE